MSQPIDEVFSFTGIPQEKILEIATALGFDVSKGKLLKKQTEAITAVNSIIDRGEADTIEQAIELYKLQGDVKVAKTKSPANLGSPPPEENSEVELFSITEMTSLAKERLDIELTPRLLSRTMEVTGLEDKKFYTKHEVEKWLVVTKKIIFSEEEDLTLEGAAAKTIANNEIQTKKAIDQVTKNIADGMPAYARESFFHNTARAFDQEQPLTEFFVEQVTNNILAEKEGKCPSHSISEIKWIQSNLNPSPPSSSQPKLKSATISNPESTSELKQPNKQ